MLRVFPSAPLRHRALRASKRANGRCSAFCGARYRPLWPRRPPDTAAAAHIPPPTPPLWPSRRLKLPPRIIFYFLFFIFHPSPFLFFLIPVGRCFSICIVFSHICPFFFDLTAFLCAADSFPICYCFMPLNRRFHACMYCAVGSFRIHWRLPALEFRVLFEMLFRVLCAFSFILPFSRVLRHFYSFADSFLTYAYFRCLNRRYCVLRCSAFFGCFINDC